MLQIFEPGYIGSEFDMYRHIYRRIEQKVEEYLEEDKFGLRKKSVTREAILALRVLIEQKMSQNKPVFLVFVDLEKAFNNVQWEKMFIILKHIGVFI